MHPCKGLCYSNPWKNMASCPSRRDKKLHIRFPSDLTIKPIRGLIIKSEITGWYSNPSDILSKVDRRRSMHTYRNPKNVSTLTCPPFFANPIKLIARKTKDVANKI
jgi:hypothetical protein